MTDPMPPLALDLWETVYGEVMNGFTGSNRVWITRTEGRAYMDITPFLGFRQTREGIVETIAAVSRSAAEGTEQLLAERRGEFDIDMSLATLPALLRTAASVLPILARLFWQGIAPFVRGGGRHRRVRDRAQRVGEGTGGRYSGGRRAGRVGRERLRGFSTEFVSEVSPKSMRVVIGPLAGTVIEWVVPDADATIVEAAARGSEAEVGTRMTLALGNIADIARETPAVEQAILDGRPYEAVCAVDGSEAFVEAFDEFIVEFGHRAVGEFDPSRPRWRDDPSPARHRPGNLAGEKPAHTSLGSVSANGRHRPRSTSYKRVPSEGCSGPSAGRS